MKPPKPKTKSDPQSDDLAARVEALEDAVFPPGGPGLSVQLAELGNRIQGVHDDLARELKSLDARQTERIKKAYEILAEVKGALDSLAKSVGRPGTMGG